MTNGVLVSPAPLRAPPNENSIAINGCMDPKNHTKITVNLITSGSFIKKPDDTIYIPLGSKHRIENPYKKPVKIIEAQIGSILKETDIVRYQDIYGRV